MGRCARRSSPRVQSLAGGLKEGTGWHLQKGARLDDPETWKKRSFHPVMTKRKMKKKKSLGHWYQDLHQREELGSFSVSFGLLRRLCRCYRSTLPCGCGRAWLVCFGREKFLDTGTGEKKKTRGPDGGSPAVPFVLCGTALCLGCVRCGAKRTFSS